MRVCCPADEVDGADRLHFSHTRTHLPHRMHFAGSRTIDGWPRPCAPASGAEVVAPADAEVRRETLQLALGVPRTVQAVVRVIGEEQFDQRAARVDGARRMGLHLQAGGRRNAQLGTRPR